MVVTMWKKSTGTLHVLDDKYAMRFVEELDCRCTAVTFFLGTATFSDTVAFWYRDYASRSEAVRAAKAWLMRGALEKRMESEVMRAKIAREPEIEKRSW